MPNIHVTKTYLPNREKYDALLDRIWDSSLVTNNAPLNQQLEKRLRNFLHVPYLQYVSNGTIALQLALNILELEGEVLTTPFTYVATANSIIWQKCTPVFVDIDAQNFNIDIAKLEQKLSPKTSAVLAVHVFGYPAPVEALKNFTDSNDLDLIYDAAHAFGCSYKGRSLADYGDLATLSFHATKVFHTIEGGAVVTHNKEFARKVRLGATHGHEYDDYLQVGINAKNSEFHAGVGLLNLDDFEQVVAGRKERFDYYLDLLNTTNLYIPKPEDYDDFQYNYAYFPVVFASEENLLKTIEALNEVKVYPRRYFFPSLNTLHYLNASHCPVAEDIASRILCLPLYHDLAFTDVEKIATIVNNCIS